MTSHDLCHDHFAASMIQRCWRFIRAQPELMVTLSIWSSVYSAQNIRFFARSADPPLVKISLLITLNTTYWYIYLYIDIHCDAVGLYLCQTLGQTFGNNDIAFIHSHQVRFLSRIKLIHQPAAKDYFNNNWNHILTMSYIYTYITYIYPKICGFFS